MSEATVIKLGEAHFKASDGVDLFHRWWLPAAAEPGQIVGILHGIGYEGSPYEVIGRPLAEAGIGAYALDARGHGRSGGRPGSLGSSSVVLDDVATFVDEIRARHPKSQAYLLADSMGTLFALAYAARRPACLAGLVLVAPAVRLRLARLATWSLVQLPFWLLWDRDRPFISLVGHRLECSSRDHAFKHARKSDPLGMKAVSARYLLTLARMTLGCQWRYPKRVSAPALIVQGGKDRLMQPSAALRLCRQLKGPETHLLYLADAWHTLLWDPEAAAVLPQIVDWIRRRRAGRQR
jgi:acylglycerol lipase